MHNIIYLFSKLELCYIIEVHLIRQEMGYINNANYKQHMKTTKMTEAIKPQTITITQYEAIIKDLTNQQRKTISTFDHNNQQDSLSLYR